MRATGKGLAALAACAALAVCGCHSNRIDATVENRTGHAISLLEVDYPSASFGSDALAADAKFPYRFKVRDSGPVKVQYTEAPGNLVRQATGPTLHEGQQGLLEIVLLPGGKVEFHPQLTQGH